MWATSNPLRLARLRCGYRLIRHPRCPSQHSFSFRAFSPSLSLANSSSWTWGTDPKRPTTDGSSTPPPEPGTETAVEPPRSIEEAFEAAQESITEPLFDQAAELSPTNAIEEVESGNRSAPPPPPQVSETTDPKAQEPTSEGEHVATIPRMVTSLFARGILPTKTVHIYWSQPIRTVWMAYDDQATAEEVKTKFDLGEYTILGHAISPSLSHRLSGGVPVAELALVSIPAGIPKEYIKAAVEKHHLPKTITLGRAIYTADVNLAGDSIRSELANIGALRQWRLQPGTTIWSKNSARVTFIDPADAPRAIASLRNRVVAVGRSGAVRLEIRQTHRAGFMIPLALFEHLRVRIDDLKEKWAPRHVDILTGQITRVYRQLRLEGDQLRDVEAAEAELDAILEGEVVMDQNGCPLWNQVFSITGHALINQPAFKQLMMLEQALGVKVIRDTSSSRLILYGPEAQRRDAIRFISDIVSRGSITETRSHYWQELDMERFASTLASIAPSFRKRNASIDNGSVVRKVLPVAKSVMAATLNRETYHSELERIRKATGFSTAAADAKSSGPVQEVEEELVFHKIVPDLTPYASAVLDARLNPRQPLSEHLNLGVVRYFTSHPATDQSPARKEAVVSPLVRFRVLSKGLKPVGLTKHEAALKDFELMKKSKFKAIRVHRVRSKLKAIRVHT